MARSNSVWSKPRGISPCYTTALGQAFHGDALTIAERIRSGSINLVLTSPPYALRKKKPYGNPGAEDYVEWFRPFAHEFRRILRPDGSFILNIGGSWEKGRPTRELYHYDLLIELCRKIGFHLAQEFFWCKPASLPTPTEWAARRRVRAKDAVEYVWWLSKTPWPKADNRRVLRPYSPSMRLLMKNGCPPRVHPSGHRVDQQFAADNGGSIPPNFLLMSNAASRTPYLRLCRERGLKPHPARFPVELPAFFISFLTEQGDTVLDPFAGSNTTGEAAEGLGRRWIAVEDDEDYVRGSRLRFPRSQNSKHVIERKPDNQASR